MKVSKMLSNFDLHFLRDAVQLVDGKLSLLERNVESSDDGPLILDEFEYVTGFGFVACQTYITAIASRGKIQKQKSLTEGPKHLRSGQPFANLVFAAANHWKHSSEWSPETSIQRNNRNKQTLQAFRSLGVDPKGEYPVAEALHQMLAPHPSRFKHLLPFLTQWRDVVLR